MRGPADADTIATVVDAFQHAPMSETDRMLVQVLIDNPDASSEQLTEAMGWKDQAWQLHFGKMCERREHLLWPAPFEPKRNAPFYSGILADFDEDTRGFTLKARGRRSLRPTRAACRKARHEPAQGDQLRDRGLRLARRARLALRERRRGAIRPRAGALSARPRRMGAGDASRRRGRRWRATTAPPRRTSCSTACASNSTTGGRSTCCGMASR